MAKLEYELKGNYETILNELDTAVLEGSMSASLEDSSDFHVGDSRCSVRVYERYSAFGGNRVSMNLTLYSSEGRIFLTAITSGGSQAIFFKINTVGEESFLDTVRDVVESFKR